jgi:hypothetical protein
VGGIAVFLAVKKAGAENVILAPPCSLKRFQFKMSKIEQAGTEWSGSGPEMSGVSFGYTIFFFKTATGCNWLQLSAIGCKKSEEVGSLLKQLGCGAPRWVCGAQESGS